MVNNTLEGTECTSDLGVALCGGIGLRCKTRKSRQAGFSQGKKEIDSKAV